jgi:hypothetical protein
MVIEAFIFSSPSTFLHAAGQAAHVPGDVAEERGAWLKRHMVDAAVQGLVHFEHGLGHATSFPDAAHPQFRLHCATGCKLNQLISSCKRFCSAHERPTLGLPDQSDSRGPGDRWSLIVIRDLMFGNRRPFRELLTGLKRQ